MQIYSALLRKVQVDAALYLFCRILGGFTAAEIGVDLGTNYGQDGLVRADKFSCAVDQVAQLLRVFGIEGVRFAQCGKALADLLVAGLVGQCPFKTVAENGNPAE